MIKTIQKLPQNIFVGLVAFNKNIMLCDFSNGDEPSFVCMNGSSDYSEKNFTRLKEGLELVSNVDPRQQTKIITTKYYVPLVHNEQKLIKAI